MENWSGVDKISDILRALSQYSEIKVTRANERHLNDTTVVGR